MKRIPFLSNSARRGLLFLEWIIIIVVIGSFIWSWYEPKEKSGPEKELPTTSYAKKQTNPSRSANYAVAEEKVETFPFDPNTADSTALLKLGLAGSCHISVQSQTWQVSHPRGFQTLTWYDV